MKVAYIEENILDDFRTNKVKLARHNQKQLIDKIKDERKEYYDYQQLYKVIDTQPLLEDMRENKTTQGMELDYRLEFPKIIRRFEDDKVVLSDKKDVSKKFIEGLLHSFKTRIDKHINL